MVPPITMNAAVKLNRSRIILGVSIGVSSPTCKQYEGCVLGVNVTQFIEVVNQVWWYVT